MSQPNFPDAFKRVTAFDQWGRQPRGPASRFHHHVTAPDQGFGRWKIASQSHPPGPEPALDWQIWNLAPTPGEPVVLVVNFTEHPDFSGAGLALLESLASITVRGIDLTPVRGGPGEVTILRSMIRDNLLTRVTPIEPAHDPLALEFLRDLDTWLLGDWPMDLARERAAVARPVDVTLQPLRDHARPGEPLPLTVGIRRGDRVLEAREFGLRFVSEPGQVEFADGGYTYTFRSPSPGEAVVRLSVVGPAGEYGRATVRIPLRP